MRYLNSRVWLAAMGAAFLLTLGLAGCDKSQASPSEAANAPKAGPSEVRIGYFANLTHAQAVMGVASGELARSIAPAKLDTKIFNAGPSLIEALLGGEIDIGYVGPGPAIAGYTASSGKGLKVISGAAANGVVIVARPDTGIASLADLTGHKVATPQIANTQDIAARHYLKSERKLTDLSGIVPIANAEQIGMMQSGQIDAAWVPEPWGARLILEAKAKLIAEEKDLWPDKQFATTVVIATPKFIEAHPDVVERILSVHRSWTVKLQQDPAGQLPSLGAALFDLTHKRLPPGTLEQAITRVKFTDDPLLPSIQAMAQWTYDLRFAKQQPNLQGLVASRGN